MLLGELESVFGEFYAKAANVDTAFRPQQLQLNFVPDVRSFDELDLLETERFSIVPEISGMGTALDNYYSQIARSRLAIARVALQKMALRGETVNALVPVYLKKVPIDPFSGTSLRFINESGVLYSIGTDLRDDGGNVMEDHRGQSYDHEISVSLPVSLWGAVN